MSEAQRRTERVLQIHVSRRCNLKCLHCYSSSGPDAREALDPRHIIAALPDARALGYTVVSLSGGEPFLYPHMRDVLRAAKANGFHAGVVTNGMFLDERRLDPLVGCLDLVAISLDGAPERHDRMRAHPKAFEVMANKLPALRKSAIPFGFLFTLSRDNIGEIEWAAEFAVAAGASLLQIHPLDDVGRAAETGGFEELVPDWQAGLAAAQVALRLKRRYGDRLRIVVDFQPAGERLAKRCREGIEARPLADLATTLCIETDGTIVPAGHGFGRQFVLGKLGEAPLRELAEAWRVSGRASAFDALISETRARHAGVDAPPIANLEKSYRDASLAA